MAHHKSSAPSIPSKIEIGAEAEADVAHDEQKEKYRLIREAADRGERVRKAVETYNDATNLLWAAAYSPTFDPNPFVKSIQNALLEACKALKEANRIVEWEEFPHTEVYKKFRYYNHREMTLPSYKRARKLFDDACFNDQADEESLVRTWSKESLRDTFRWLRIILNMLSGDGAVIPGKEKVVPALPPVSAEAGECLPVSEATLTASHGPSVAPSVGENADKAEPGFGASARLGAPRKNAAAVDHAIEMRKRRPRPSWKDVWTACKERREDEGQNQENFKAAVLSREKLKKTKK